LEWRNERKEAMMSCDKSFELHDDVTVLEFMEMAKVENEEELRQVLVRCPDIATLLLERNPDIVRNKTPAVAPAASSEALGAVGCAAGGSSSSGAIAVKCEPKEGGSN